MSKLSSFDNHIDSLLSTKDYFSEESDIVQFSAMKEPVEKGSISLWDKLVFDLYLHSHLLDIFLSLYLRRMAAMTTFISCIANFWPE